MRNSNMHLYSVVVIAIYMYYLYHLLHHHYFLRERMLVCVQIIVIKLQYRELRKMRQVNARSENYVFLICRGVCET